MCYCNAYVSLFLAFVLSTLFFCQSHAKQVSSPTHPKFLSPVFEHPIGNPASVILFQIEVPPSSSATNYSSSIASAITHSDTSWAIQLKNNLARVVIGIILIVSGLAIFLWGEIVAALHDILYYAARTMAKEINNLNMENNGELVVVKSSISTEQVLTDYQFNIHFVNCIKWKRNVEMLQWNEEIEFKGGRKMYYYIKKWSSIPIDSSRFKDNAPHTNPPFLFQNMSGQLKEVKCGDFILGENLISQMNWFSKRLINFNDLTELDGKYKNYFTVYMGSLYHGYGMNPDIGDVRITYEEVKCSELTIVGEQIYNSFVEWSVPCCGMRCCAKSREKIEKEFDEKDAEASPLVFHPVETKKKSDSRKVLQVFQGHVSTETVFKDKERTGFYTYFSRFFGYVSLVVGTYLFMYSFLTLLPSLSFFGFYFSRLFSIGLTVSALITAAVVMLIIISFTWMIVRPFLATICLLLGMGTFLLVRFVGHPY